MELGIDALALQTVCGLIRGTAGKAGDPDALRERVHHSDHFKNEAAKFDFSKPGVLKQAIEMKIGARISEMLLELQQQKGGPVGNGWPKNIEQSVQNEQNKQKRNVIV